MRVLAIESSCDETAAAIVENGRSVMSSIIASQVDAHQIYGGVVPEIASRMHIEAISGVTRKALEEASISISDIDAVAVTAAPGLIGALLVGVNFAKGIAFTSKKPLIPVHHLKGHIAANYLVHHDLKPPFLCLVVSGGHSHIINVESYTSIKIIGKTRDDAAGEVFDKAARTMGLPYPGGIHLDKIADNGDENAFILPHPKVSGSPYDYSFSGLKTAVINIYHNSEQRGKVISVPDLCASFRKAVTDVLIDKFMKVANETGAKTLVLAGGVSANSRLRKKMTEICQKIDIKLYFPPLSLCGDNAAMIGAQAYYEFLDGNLAEMDLNAKASMAIDGYF